MIPEVGLKSCNEALQLQNARDCRDTYNSLRPVAQGRAGDPGVRLPAQAVARGIQEVDEIVANTSERLMKKYDQLYSLLNEYIDYTGSRDEIYEGADLLALPYYLLQQTLYQISRNSANHASYAAYVSGAIAAAAKISPTDDERAIRSPPYSEETGRGTFFDKCMALIAAMDQRSGPAIFHALVVLKSILHSGNRRCRLVRQEETHKIIDRVIRAFVDDDFIPADARDCSGQPCPRHHRRHVCTVSMHGFRWYSDPFFQIRYYDFAAASRQLKAAYSSQICDAPPRFDESDDWCNRMARFRCYHLNSYRLLTYLQQRAWSEIRAKVFATFGTLLPAELTEHIFHEALLVEEIPLEPKGWEKYAIKERSWHKRHSKMLWPRRDLLCPRVSGRAEAFTILAGFEGDLSGAEAEFMDD